MTTYYRKSGRKDTPISPAPNTHKNTTSFRVALDIATAIYLAIIAIFLLRLL